MGCLQIRWVFSRSHWIVFLLFMFKLYLAMSYYKYNYENTKEGEEVRDTERQETFLYTWPSYGVIKFLAEQKKLNGS